MLNSSNISLMHLIRFNKRPVVEVNIIVTVDQILKLKKYILDVKTKFK